MNTLMVHHKLGVNLWIIMSNEYTLVPQTELQECAHLTCLL